jgi:hypothetical protein
MTREQEIDKLLQEDEDGCDHPRVSWEIPTSELHVDSEGGVILTKCVQCGEVLHDGHIYE